VNPADAVFLDRALELAQRGLGSTSPNPPVGAVVVSDGRIVGEGYHHHAGAPHAEIEALLEAGDNARGATLYVSLEPCAHHGRTPPCTEAILNSGIARVVGGVADPTARSARAGFEILRARGLEVVNAHSERGREMIEPFARAARSERPYIALKLAVSLDGFVASKPNLQEWLTSEEARAFVRDLRIAHDALAVGAQTVRIDNPQLTVRPPHDRELPYARVVFCQASSLPAQSKIFAAQNGYAKTTVVAPASARAMFGEIERVADLVWIEGDPEEGLNLMQALRALRSRGISSLLCEGGPTLASRLIDCGLVDRFYWIVAPRLLGAVGAVRALSLSAARSIGRLRFDRIEQLGADVLISGTFEHDV